MKSIVRASIAVLALGIGAASIVGREPSASAAPSVSPFTGSYVGYYVPGTPFGSNSSYALTVSDTGKVTGTGSGVEGGFDNYALWTAEVSGRIGDGGHLAIGTSATVTHYGGDEPSSSKFHTHGRATMTRTEDGSLSGVTDDGTAFFWYAVP